MFDWEGSSLGRYTGTIIYLVRQRKPRKLWGSGTFRMVRGLEDDLSFPLLLMGIKYI